MTLRGKLCCIFLFWILSSACCRASKNTGTFVALRKDQSDFTSKGTKFGLLDRGLGYAKMIELSNDASAPKIAKKDVALKRPVTHLKATFLTLTLYGLLFRMVWSKQYDLWKWTAISYVLYLIEAAMCSTRRYLSNSYTPVQVRHYLDKLQALAATVRWDAECYHYRRRYSRSHHSSESKVVTHRASHSLLFKGWRDITDTAIAERALTHGGPNSATFVKITLSKLVVFANEASFISYSQQENNFLASMRSTDRYTDSSVHVQVDEYLPKILAVRTGLAGKGTGLAKVFWYWIFTLTTFTVPFRIWFAKHCDDVEITLTKETTI